MTTPIRFVEAVSEAARQMILASCVGVGVLLVVAVALVGWESYLEARRRAASRIWKDL